MSPRTLITDEQILDQDFVGESEFNQFFNTVVITGSETVTGITQTFKQYFPGQGIITGIDGAVVITGTETIQVGLGAGVFPNAIVGDSFISVSSGTNVTAISADAIVGGTNITVVSGTNMITISSTAGGTSLPIVGDSFVSVVTGTNSINLSSDAIIPGSSNITVTSGSNVVEVDLSADVTLSSLSATTISGANIQVGGSVTAQQGHFSTSLTVSGIPINIAFQYNTNDNLLINGGFMVTQRQNISTPYTSSSLFPSNDGSYTLDRWIILSDGNGVTSVGQEFLVVPSGTFACAELSVASNNVKFGFLQILENSRTCSALLGPVSLQFEARVNGSSINTIKAAILSWIGGVNAPPRDVVSSWNTSGTNPTLVSQWAYLNTPTAITPTSTEFSLHKIENINVPGDTDHLGVFIWVDDTTTTVDDQLRLANIKLEKGPVCSLYRESDFTDEFLRCQRFFCKTYNYLTNVGLSTSAGALSVHSPSNSAGDVRAIWRFPVHMVTTPTITTYNPSTAATGSWNRGGTAISSTVANNGTGGCIITNSAATSSDQDHDIHATASAEVGL